MHYNASHLPDTTSTPAGFLIYPVVQVFMLAILAMIVSGETLWLEVQAKSPSKWQPYTELGVYYGEQERVNACGMTSAPDQTAQPARDGNHDAR